MLICVTTKSSTLSDYTGSAGAHINKDMDQVNYRNAESNPTKEIIAQGREPTLNNVKVSNGMDSLNVKYQKNRF